MIDNNTHRSRGFGFVCYATPEEANNAIAHTNGREVGSRPIYTSLAQTKDERFQFLAAMRARAASAAAYQVNGMGLYYQQPVAVPSQQQVRGPFNPRYNPAQHMAPMQQVPQVAPMRYAPGPSGYPKDMASLPPQPNAGRAIYPPQYQQQCETLSLVVYLFYFVKSLVCRSLPNMPFSVWPLVYRKLQVTCSSAAILHPCVHTFTPTFISSNGNRESGKLTGILNMNWPSSKRLYAPH
jgi:hypothetical protein